MTVATQGDLSTLTSKELHQLIVNKDISVMELVELFLNRIKQYDPQLNAYITVVQDKARAQAIEVDNKIRSGELNHPLAGVPYALKDLFCTKGILTSCGSKMLSNFISPYDATVYDKLNQAGAVLLGKVNMDEFAMGSSNENSYYGAVANPWDLSRIPGGSSGGSAAAVAAGLAAYSLGSDTGGSVRQPASYCGISSIKPTYGRISRYGMTAYASSLDQCGPMARSAEDMALILQTISGFDVRDSTSANVPVPDYSATLNEPLTGLRIGIPKEFFADGLDADVAKVINEAVEQFKRLGATVKEVSLPNSHLSVAAYYVIAPAEASANLSRFDGVRFGHSCDAPTNLQDLYERSRWEGFGDEVKRRIVIGTYALSSGYYDAYYLKAQKIRRLIKNDFVAAFNDVDVLMGPVTPTTAFKIGEKSDDPIAMYLGDIYTLPISLAGVPAVSIPVGFSDNLPVGLQIIGDYFNEAKLLNVAHSYQQVTDWHRQSPSQFTGA
ncbi:MAG: Asp-tRNA(Asn)/Glu-tRNA(Gln) amidotransferase subunit GatA [Methylococcales bacterium]|nr:Asp-tRNA(Asn)/Glu-tRNA(Gln) amidotransferase subunit GatA [Methylococcales bacterium]MDP3840183.1 Asp-tRNA(Asn)/Glu-tRNA(Gln) amidotransferase subunit GatA [Methylococcales bacterium]